MKDTIEKIVSDAILEEGQKIELNGKTYMVAPPTIATLIEVSKYISQLPDINIEESQNVTTAILAHAAEFEYLGDVAAILILGKKNLSTKKRVKAFKLFGRTWYKTIHFDNRRELANEILLNLNTKDLSDIISTILGMLRMDFFFGILIFLKEVNLTRATKTTVSGPLSPGLQRPMD